MSFLSAVENTLDTLHGVDDVRGVVAIRDRVLAMRVFSEPPQTFAMCGRDQTGSVLLENRPTPHGPSVLSRTLSAARRGAPGFATTARGA